MSVRRTSAPLFLIAALTLPTVAFFPAAMHGFIVLKSALWEPLVVLAAALAWSSPKASTTPARDPGAVLAWVLWIGMGLTLAWFWLATTGHTTFVGSNIDQFSAGFRAEEWVFRHLSLGLDLQRPQAGDWMFRGVEGLAAVTLVWLAWRSRDSSAGASLGPLPRLALSLAALWCLSAALSLRPDLASPALLDWGGYLLVFVAVWHLSRESNIRSRVVSALLLVSVLNAVYGLVQALGYDPIPWSDRFGGRASGFLGNPDFLGGHMALMLPFSLALALCASVKPPVRTLRWLVVCLFGLALLVSQTRGAILGAAVGCVVALVCAHRADPGVLRRSRAALATCILVLALGASVLWVFAAPAGAARFTGALSTDPEAGRRVFLMEKSAELAWKHPLLGVGPGAFRIWFPSVEVQGLPTQDYASQPYIITEHSHNDFLQMAADSGWLAAFLWVALWVLVFVRLFRGLRRVPSQEGFFLAACLGGLTALRIHGLANFPFQIVPTESAAWAIAALGLRAALPESLLPSVPAFERVRLWRWTVVGVALASVLFVARARQCFEDGLWWLGSGQLSVKNPVAASPILLKALDMDRREDRLWSLHGQAQFDRENIWQSIGSLREAHRLNPYDAEASMRLGLALIENHLYDEAYTLLRGAVEYAPNDAALWEPLAVASYQDKKYADAVEANDWMLYYHVDELNAYTNKAAALGNLGLLPQARAALIEAQGRFPDSGKVQINLAITYYKMGMRRLAYEAWQKASVLTPSDPQVDALRTAMRP